MVYFKVKFNATTEHGQAITNQTDIVQIDVRKNKAPHRNTWGKKLQLIHPVWKDFKIIGEPQRSDIKGSKGDDYELTSNVAVNHVRTATGLSLVHGEDFHIEKVTSIPVMGIEIKDVVIAPHSKLAQY